MHWQLAQLNIARMRAPLDDPQMQGFVDGIDAMNQLAESSKGYVWRLQGESGDATDQSPFDDPLILVNLSVWDGTESLQNYAYRSEHRHFIKARREWFDTLGGAHQVLWWVPDGVVPTASEAKMRLGLLQQHGPGDWAFSFKHRAVFGEDSSITDSDLESWSSLLRRSGLGVEGIRDLPHQSIILAHQGARLLGGVAVQPCGAHGLLRSLVVAPEARGSGIGRDLLRLALQRAQIQSLASVWLLTETAAPFFAAQGLCPSERYLAPEGVQASEQFRSLCPDHSNCLMMSL